MEGLPDRGAYLGIAVARGHAAWALVEGTAEDSQLLYLGSAPCSMPNALRPWKLVDKIYREAQEATPSPVAAAVIEVPARCWAATISTATVFWVYLELQGAAVAMVERNFVRGWLRNLTPAPDRLDKYLLLLRRYVHPTPRAWIECLWPDELARCEGFAIDGLPLEAEALCAARLAHSWWTHANDTIRVWPEGHSMGIRVWRAGYDVNYRRSLKALRRRKNCEELVFLDETDDMENEENEQANGMSMGLGS